MINIGTMSLERPVLKTLTNHTLTKLWPTTSSSSSSSSISLSTTLHHCTHCISHADYYSCQLPLPIIYNHHHISSFIIVIQNHHCHYYYESISCVLLFPTSSSLPTALRQIYLSSAPPYVANVDDGDVLCVCVFFFLCIFSFVLIRGQMFP